jgi:hypothetical protein
MKKENTFLMRIKNEAEIMWKWKKKCNNNNNNTNMYIFFRTLLRLIVMSKKFSRKRRNKTRLMICVFSTVYYIKYIIMLFVISYYISHERKNEKKKFSLLLTTRVVHAWRRRRIYINTRMYIFISHIFTHIFFILFRKILFLFYLLCWALKLFNSIQYYRKQIKKNTFYYIIFANINASSPFTYFNINFFLYVYTCIWYS